MAKAAVALYRSLEADKLIAEKNYGGEMVATTIRGIEARVPVTLITASRGKQLRAEPVSSLVEQGRVHCVGAFPDLKNEMTQWQPGDASPNRLDAFVFAITELMLQTAPQATRGAALV